MVFCIVGIVVFGILGIFSGKYRTYFKEAIRCVGRQMTLRKCDTDFDNKMKSKITAKLLKRSPTAARFVYKRFSVISWIFILLMFWSIGTTGLAVYNAAAYGNCNGPESTEFCLFNPTMTGELGHSMHEGKTDGKLLPADVDDDPFVGAEDAKVTVIEFGCYTCPYTKKAEYVREKIQEEYGDKVKFVFRNFPLANHQLSRELAEASECANEQGKFWEYHKTLFDNQKVESVEKIKTLATDTGLDMQKFNECFDTRKFQDEVEKDHQDGMTSGIFGTPTFFINGRSLVGPRTWQEFKDIIDQELATPPSL